MLLSIQITIWFKIITVIIIMPVPIWMHQRDPAFFILSSLKVRFVGTWSNKFVLLLFSWMRERESMSRQCFNEWKNIKKKENNNNPFVKESKIKGNKDRISNYLNKRNTLFNHLRWKAFYYVLDSLFLNATNYLTAPSSCSVWYLRKKQLGKQR